MKFDPLAQLRVQEGTPGWDHVRSESKYEGDKEGTNSDMEPNLKKYNEKKVEG